MGSSSGRSAEAGLREYHGTGRHENQIFESFGETLQSAHGMDEKSPRPAALINSREMPDGTLHRNNVATWWGLLFAIVALGCNAAFFVGVPFQAAITWLSLLLAAVALVFLVTGLNRGFRQPEVYRGKVLIVVLTVIALLPAGLSALGFFGARKLPGATAAPQVGQKVPDFTLADTSGTPVSLDQLLAASSATSSGLPPSGEAFSSAAPKAVLLIFYRGYW
jgi:hypothetical protein